MSNWQRALLPQLVALPGPGLHHKGHLKRTGVGSLEAHWCRECLGRCLIWHLPVALRMSRIGGLLGVAVGVVELIGLIPPMTEARCPPQLLSMLIRVEAKGHARLTRPCITPRAQV